MTQRVKHKAYSRPNDGPKKDFHRPGCEGFNHNNDMVFSDKIEDWQCGKYRKGKPKEPNLF